MPTTHRLIARSRTPESAEIFTLKGANLASLWPLAAPLVQRALDHSGEYSIEEVRARVERNDAQCWCAAVDGNIVAVCITAIRSDLNGQFCELWLCGGEQVGLWIDALYLHIEPWARRIGCAHMRVIGRPGWLRKLVGYKTKFITLEKRLNDSLH